MLIKDTRCYVMTQGQEISWSFWPHQIPTLSAPKQPQNWPSKHAFFYYFHPLHTCHLYCDFQISWTLFWGNTKFSNHAAIVYYWWLLRSEGSIDILYMRLVMLGLGDTLTPEHWTLGISRAVKQAQKSYLLAIYSSVGMQQPAEVGKFCIFATPYITSV